MFACHIWACLSVASAGFFLCQSIPVVLAVFISNQAVDPADKLVSKCKTWLFSDMQSSFESSLTVSLCCSRKQVLGERVIFVCLCVMEGTVHDFKHRSRGLLLFHGDKNQSSSHPFLLQSQTHGLILSVCRQPLSFKAHTVRLIQSNV